MVPAAVSHRRFRADQRDDCAPWRGEVKRYVTGVGVAETKQLDFNLRYREVSVHHEIKHATRIIRPIKRGREVQALCIFPRHDNVVITVWIRTRTGRWLSRAQLIIVAFTTWVILRLNDSHQTTANCNRHQ
jgi:hypothetical protein